MAKEQKKTNYQRLHKHRSVQMRISYQIEATDWLLYLARIKTLAKRTVILSHLKPVRTLKVAL